MKCQSKPVLRKKSDAKNIELLACLQKVVPGGLKRLSNRSKAIKKSSQVSKAKTETLK